MTRAGGASTQEAEQIAKCAYGKLLRKSDETSNATQIITLVPGLPEKVR